MIKNISPTTLDALVGEAGRLKAEGMRLVTASCTELDEKSVDIIYHFDKDLKLTHLRLTVDKDTAIPSISGVYLAAFLIENEMQDQFGLKFEGLAIDFGGTLYLEEEVTGSTPFCRFTVVNKEAEPQTETQE